MTGSYAAAIGKSVRTVNPRSTMGASDIEGHARLVEALRGQASALLAMQALDPRTAGIFATQQRWLLAHLALSLYFDGGAAGFWAAKLISAAEDHEIASGNTADAFLREMLKYGYVAAVLGGRDRRLRPLEVTDRATGALAGWLRIHLASLDSLDGGDRRTRFDARPEAIARMQPRIADGLLASAAVRQPAPTFSMFTWLNEGGVLMDWLYVGLVPFAADAKRILTSVSAFADIGERIRLSRTHLARKLRAAEAMESLGWLGARGASPMWVSMAFVREYHAQQAAKLAIVDGAFASAAADGAV